MFYKLSFPLLLPVSLIYFLTLNYASLVDSIVLRGLFSDEVSLYMIYITVFVLFISWTFTLTLYSPSLIFRVMFFMFLCCVLVFTSDSMFILYFFYEASLLPILYIIVKWGVYPERSLRGMMLLLYTSVFTFPFLYFLFNHYLLNKTFSFSYFYYSPLSSYDVSLITLLIFLTFAVKLPVYGLHFWLPIAHVEAPTFGRIILAGVLLKLGGVGLLRFTSICDYSNISTFSLSYLIIRTFFVTLTCCFQSDFKRLVAYSSVRHIITIPFLLISNNFLSLKTLLLVMLFHGLSSPALFVLVGVIYSFYQTRQLVKTRGILTLSPLLSLILILAFFFTLSAPPFPSFVREVFFIFSSLFLSKSLIILFLLYAFFSLVYNLNWLSSLLFYSPLSSNQSLILSFQVVFTLMITFAFSFILLVLISFILYICSYVIAYGKAGVYMLVWYTHLRWFFFIGVGLLLSLHLSLYVLYSNESLFLSFIFIDLPSIPLSFSIYLDWISTSFIRVILLIRTVIMVYSYNYMAPYSKAPYFLWATILFIISILLVVTISNLFFIILGWDGLGLVSFFLIVYYQNTRSIYSGVFTLLMNRIGDCFFLVTIAFFFYSYNTLTPFSSDLISPFVISFIVLTFITKSAIYPFSPWLPLAIAAPTPISALVHSSTLVTAGLYLMMRYSYVLYSSYPIIKILLILSLFTSFYAGINALFETDLKKLIALSTLSHLGFIGLAFSAGLIQLAFFHLLTHALFKSLLFITIGDIIINLNHSQDIRYLSSGILYTPASSIIIYVSLLNLLGLPNLRGFFSKDLILEIINYSNISFVSLLIIFLNIFFTYFYTYQLFYYSFQPNKILPYQNFHSLCFIHVALIALIGALAVSYGFFFLKSVFVSTIFYPVPPLLKFYPTVLLLAILFFLFAFKRQLLVRSPLIHYYFSNMMFLSNFIINVVSNLYYRFLFSFVRSTELGSLNYFANQYSVKVGSYASLVVTKLTLLPPIRTLLYTSYILLLIYILLWPKFV